MKEPSQHCMCRQTRSKLPFYFRFTITGRGEAFQKDIIDSSMFSIQNASPLLNLPKPASFLQGLLQKQNILYSHKLNRNLRNSLYKPRCSQPILKQVSQITLKQAGEFRLDFLGDYQIL